MNTALLSGYIITLLAVVLSVVALIVGLAMIGKPGVAGAKGPPGANGVVIPADYVVVPLTAAAPDAGSSYNAKYFLVQGPIKVSLTARNCVPGDTFLISNATTGPVTVSPQAFSFPTQDFVLDSGHFARCGVSGLQDGSQSLLCMVQPYTPA